MELEATHSHLYPGARGRILHGAARKGPVIVHFADGTAARGELEGDLLRLATHSTAAGTRIAAKAWRIAFAGDRFRITARAMP